MTFITEPAAISLPTWKVIKLLVRLFTALVETVLPDSCSKPEQTDSNFNYDGRVNLTYPLARMGFWFLNETVRVPKV